MIRAEIIAQAKEEYKKFIATDGKENEMILFGAMMRYDNPLTYGIKFIKDSDFENLVVICRGGGGEATCCSLDYGIEGVDEVFDQFEKLFDIEYLWFSYNNYEIGEDSKGIYVGEFGYGCNDETRRTDEYEECYIIKRFRNICFPSDMYKVKKYIDKLNKKG